MSAGAVRADIRRAYRCPCDGVSHLVHGVLRSRRAAALMGSHDEIEAVTGIRPTACAWWGLFDPDVAAVIHAHAWLELHQVREWWGADPEAWLVEAVGLYDRALERCRADRRQRMRPAAAPPRAPDGWVVEGVTRG